MNILLLLALFQEPASDVQFQTQWIEFVASANGFVENYFGCPRGTRDVSPEHCRMALGSFDSRAWELTRKRAAALFQLQFPKEKKKRASLPANDMKHATDPKK